MQEVTDQEITGSSVTSRSACSIGAMVLCALSTVWTGCSESDGGGMGPTVPTGGTLEVAVRTMGQSIDSDGYGVSVDGTSVGAIDVNGSVTLTELAAGDHVVELTDVAANCTVAGDNPRTLTVSEGGTASTTFQVDCALATGSLAVTTSTRGRETDTDGYALSVDGGAAVAVGVSETVVIADLPVGNHELELTGLAAPCAVVGDASRTVAIEFGATTPITFDIVCQSALRDQIAFSTNRDGNSEIYVMNADGSGLVNLTHHPASDLEPAVSPDGTRILFVRDGEIHVMKANGSDPINLTKNSASGNRPRWSPDGTKIAFTSGGTGGFNIFVMNADGSDPVNLTNAHGTAASWSPDGERIAFTTNRTGDFEIFVMNADGSNQVNLTEDPGRSDFAPAWSPDGARIAFSSDEIMDDGSLGPGEIFVMDIDGSDRVNLTNDQGHDAWSSWSTDGFRMVFVSNRTGDLEVFKMNADGSMQVNLTNAPAVSDVPGFPQAWSP